MSLDITRHDSDTTDPLDGPTIEKERLFAFETVDENHFRCAPIPSTLNRLYGGQVTAQAVAALQRTAGAGSQIHSCHAYFIRTGDINLPLDFFVTRDRDGRSFSARRVVVEQAGEIIMSMSGSLHIPEAGPDYRSAMPDVAPPEDLASMEEVIAAAGDDLPWWHRPFWRRDHLFEWRAVEPFRMFDHDPHPAKRHFWFRMKLALGDDLDEHLRYFAYASDMHILYSGLAPLGLGWAREGIQAASLDHSIWFHDRFRVDDWLLCELDSPVLTSARSLGTGKVYTRDGRLVASIAQEGLLRMQNSPSTAAP